MQSPKLDREFHRILYALAALIVVEPLLLLAVIVVHAQQPDYLWLPIAVWIAVTVAFVVWVVVELRRNDIGLVARPAVPAVWRMLAGVTLATIALTIAAILDESRPWLWIGLYTIAVAAMIVWMVRWQAAHLGFRCTACGTLYAGSASQWLLTMNMGAYKRVSCPQCPGHWAEIVSRRS